MTTLPKGQMEQLLPVLGLLVKTIKSKGKVSDTQLKIFLESFSLENEDWAFTESKKWGGLVQKVYDSNDEEVKEAVEISLLSIGIPPANVRIALAELNNTKNDQEKKSTYPVNPEDIPPPELKVSTEKLSFGRIEVSKSKSLSFTVEGSSGIIENEIECLKLNKTRFDSGKEEIIATMSGGHEGEIFFDKIFLKTEHETREIVIQAEFISKPTEQQKPVITKKLENTNYERLQEKLSSLKNQVNYLISKNKFDSALQETNKLYQSVDLSNIEDKQFFDEQISQIKKQINAECDKTIIELKTYLEKIIKKDIPDHLKKYDFDKAKYLTDDFNALLAGYEIKDKGIDKLLTDIKLLIDQAYEKFVSDLKRELQTITEKRIPELIEKDEYDKALNLLDGFNNKIDGFKIDKRRFRDEIDNARNKINTEKQNKININTVSNDSDISKIQPNNITSDSPGKKIKIPFIIAGVLLLFGIISYPLFNSVSDKELQAVKEIVEETDKSTSPKANNIIKGLKSEEERTNEIYEILKKTNKISENRENIKMLISEAESLIANKNTTLAIKKLEETRAKIGDETYIYADELTDYYNYMAYISLSKNDNNKALELFNKSLGVSKNRVALYESGVIYYQKKDYKKAKANLEEAISMFKKESNINQAYLKVYNESLKLVDNKLKSGK